MSELVLVLVGAFSCWRWYWRWCWRWNRRRRVKPPVVLFCFLLLPTVLQQTTVFETNLVSDILQKDNRARDTKHCDRSSAWGHAGARGSHLLAT